MLKNQTKLQVKILPESPSFYTSFTPSVYQFYSSITSVFTDVINDLLL